MAYHKDCRHFTGYKPCRYKRPCEGCTHYDPVSDRIAVLSLEALGAVLRSTCLLPALKRKFPKAHITWITLPSARPLIVNNPYVDRLICVEAHTSAALGYLKFDRLYAVDKSLEAGALAQTIKARHKYGFGLNEDGVIEPLNPQAEYQYQVGLDDELKFFKNEKPETRMLAESMDLTWERDPYVLAFTSEEEDKIATMRENFRQGASGVIGFNTGCSTLYPYKKFTTERSIETIAAWRRAFPDFKVALLGGREDRERQAQMKAAFADDPLVFNTPCDQGLRAGILAMAATDMVFTGCSLGLHMAIALEKPVVCWFGVSCAQEIDLYDRGIKLQAEVSCSPCWKKACTNEPKCFDQVAPEAVIEATRKVLELKLNVL